MRILHITDDLTVGGSQLVLVALANSQAASGHSVAVAAGAGPLWDELSPAVELHRHEGGRMALHRLLPYVHRLLRAAAWDVVHTHQRGVSTAVWLTRGGTRLAHVEHVHSEFGSSSWRGLSFRGDALIACGSAVARMLVEDRGRRSETVRTIPNGVADHGVRRRPAPAGDDRLRIVNIARADAVKDPARFVAVVGELHRRGIPVQATWVGDGGLLTAARALVTEAGLDGVVAFPGGRRPAVDALADADLFLLTSQREGLPLSVLEAAAAGCPVVAPEVGGLPDAVRHGENGWLFPPTAGPDELADLIATACADRSALDRVGMRARHVYEQEFGLDRVAAAVEEVYRALVTLPGTDRCPIAAGLDLR
ncbi:glycosyltransferase family 4 protein [Geodermatophilus chilensis]|uniref:glycosyltransferase family 4 protein n=1 Tax=Geodermatophilus chilensis TaxID=2035835 RepID=UPI000C2672EA|nr:glycosyltransferase family 4 protein [Geodermatophilus chilensis]